MLSVCKPSYARDLLKSKKMQIHLLSSFQSAYFLTDVRQSWACKYRSADEAFYAHIMIVRLILIKAVGWWAERIPALIEALDSFTDRDTQTDKEIFMNGDIIVFSSGNWIFELERLFKVQSCQFWFLFCIFIHLVNASSFCLWEVINEI